MTKAVVNRLEINNDVLLKEAMSAGFTEEQAKFIVELVVELNTKAVVN